MSDHVACAAIESNLADIINALRAERDQLRAKRAPGDAGPGGGDDPGPRLRVTGAVYSQIIVEAEPFIAGTSPAELQWYPTTAIEILGASFYCSNASDDEWFIQTGQIRPKTMTGAYAKVLGGSDAHRKYLGLYERPYHGGGWEHFQHHGLRVDPSIGEYVFCGWWSHGVVAPVIIYILLQYREVE